MANWNITISGPGCSNCIHTHISTLPASFGAIERSDISFDETIPRLCGHARLLQNIPLNDALQFLFGLIGNAEDIIHVVRLFFHPPRTEHIALDLCSDLTPGTNELVVVLHAQIKLNLEHLARLGTAGPLLEDSIQIGRRVHQLASPTGLISVQVQGITGRMPQALGQLTRLNSSTHAHGLGLLMVGQSQIALPGQRLTHPPHQFSVVPFELDKQVERFWREESKFLCQPRPFFLCVGINLDRLWLLSAADTLPASSHPAAITAIFARPMPAGELLDCVGTPWS